MPASRTSRYTAALRSHPSQATPPWRGRSVPARIVTTRPRNCVVRSSVRVPVAVARTTRPHALGSLPGSTSGLILRLPQIESEAETSDIGLLCSGSRYVGQSWLGFLGPITSRLLAAVAQQRRQRRARRPQPVSDAAEPFDSSPTRSPWSATPTNVALATVLVRFSPGGRLPARTSHGRLRPPGPTFGVARIWPQVQVVVGESDENLGDHVAVGAHRHLVHWPGHEPGLWRQVRTLGQIIAHLGSWRQCGSQRGPRFGCTARKGWMTSSVAPMAEVRRLDPRPAGTPEPTTGGDRRRPADYFALRDQRGG